MKKVLIGALSVTILIIVLIIGYVITSFNNRDIIWYSAISFFALFALFTGICLYAYERGRKEFVANTWLILISVGLTSVVADLVTGYLLIKPISAKIYADQVAHHRHIPNTRILVEKIEYRIVININQFGLRGPDIEQDKAPGTYRILMLGDSFTFGEGVKNEEIFSSLLERRLDSPSRPVEILNAGVNSYSPVLSYLALREYLNKLDPDLVVLNLDMSDLVQEVAYRKVAVYDERGEILRVPGTDEDDARNKRSPWWSGSKSNWVDNHLYFGRLVFFYLKGLTRDRSDITVTNVVELANPVLLAHTLKSDTMDRIEQWRSIFDSIGRIKTFCDERGIRFLMTVYPWGHQINDREWVPGRNLFVPKESVISDKSIRVIEELSMKNGVAFLNLFPAFRARQLEGPLYYNYDMHWRPKGHEVMAEALENYIQGIIVGRL